MEFFWIDMTLAGRLATATRPRGGDWLADDMRAVANAGVSLLVSMLTAEENTELSVGGEALAAEAAGVQFLGIPIEDRGLPERAMPFLEGVTRAAKEVSAKRAVAVHCRMGIGRSSMFAASTLVKLGVEPDDAWRAIALVRGRPVPDVAKQRDWVRDMRDALRG
jgi:protein-tyrosine phosphatase